VTLDFNEIRQLLATIAQTDIAEVTLKSNDFELTVRKAASVNYHLSSLGQTDSLVSQPPTPGNQAVTLPLLEVTTSRDHSSTSPSTSSVSSPATKLVEVPSPMVGTFYRAPAPGEAPFVQVGDRVRSGQTVCIIEAMKLMNEIEAEVSGQVMEILLQNGEPVEYGQPLMRINPD
jgi:acetyl-CoA carboxylase biotin carboxyl carrier protein